MRWARCPSPQRDRPARSQRRCRGGIANGSVAAGRTARNGSDRAARGRMRPFAQWCTRWRPKNPLRGAPRIHGELRKLGIEVSERTVSRLLPRRGRPPSQTWRTFLANHATALVSMDFFTVPTLTGHVLFVFVLLAHQPPTSRPLGDHGPSDSRVDGAADH
jgi:hypothetical protein